MNPTSPFTRFITWFQTHRAPLGALFLALATVVGGIGGIYDNDSFVHIAALLALLGTTLTGAGMVKSDQFYRERLAVIKNRIDRRNGDSLIPVRDLKKLVDKEVGDEDNLE